MKKIFLILFTLLLTGCQNNINEYKEVSDIVVNMFQNQSYDNDALNEMQSDLLGNYLHDLNNPEINVSDFIIYGENYKIEDSNTEGIYLKENKCYIRYNDIPFEEPSDHNSESMAKVVCNGYYVVLFKDSVKPISMDYDNPKYNYRYLGYYKDSGYHFAYRSYYDGSGLIVSIGDNIEVSFENVNDLNLKKISNVSYTKYIIPGIILAAVIILSMFVKRKYS